MNLSHAYLPRPDEEAAIKVLHAALDRGITFLDTAALYGFGANETLIGRSVMERRQEFTLASKCVLGEIDGKRGLDGSPGAISRSLDASLMRLGTDYIDLFYLHRLDPAVPIEESVGALVLAREAGKIGAIGLSEMSAATIRRAHAVHPIAAVQTEYSLLTRNVEIAVLDCCAALGIGFVAFSPLTRGLLAGRLHSADYLAGDIRADMPRFVEPHFDRNIRLFQKLNYIAQELSCTPAQLCIAWLLSRRPFVVPIFGTTSLAHLDENLAGADLTLPAECFATLTRLFAPLCASGPRYNRQAQSQVDTEIWSNEALA